MPKKCYTLFSLKCFTSFKQHAVMAVKWSCCKIYCDVGSLRLAGNSAESA